jgi:predicted RNase H-like nuclease (RuvC/YqgF family)
MKTSTISLLLTSSLLLGATFLELGCATKGYQKAAATSSSLQTAATQVDLARTEVTNATSALDAFNTSSPAELRTTFKRYQENVAALDLANANLQQKTQDTEAEKNKYLATWNQNMAEMKNDEIRARSKERQQEVTAQFDQLKQRYEDAHKQFDPFIANLHDIQRLLSVDLTPDGVASAREFVEKAKANAVNVRESLDRLAEGLRTSSVNLNPAKTETK